MLDDCQQWQSNYPSASSTTIFKYFSMKRPIMEATALQCSYNTTTDTAKHNIKTEDIIEATTGNHTEAHSMATAPSMASMAAAASHRDGRCLLLAAGRRGLLLAVP